MKLLSNQRYEELLNWEARGEKKWVEMKKKFEEQLDEKWNNHRKLRREEDYCQRIRLNEAARNLEDRYSHMSKEKDSLIESQRDKITELLGIIDKLQGIRRKK